MSNVTIISDGTRADQIKSREEYMWYDVAGRHYGLNSRQVSALARKYQLPKRRVYGRMAVSYVEFMDTMKKISILLREETFQTHPKGAEHET